MTDLEAAALFLEVIPKAMRLIRNEMRANTGSELTVPQYRLLAKIAREGGFNQTLAEWMGVRPATMSGMVDGLVTRGLVKRVSGDSNLDRRKVELKVTAKGEAKYLKIRKAVMKVLAVRFQQLTPQVKADLTKGLGRLKVEFLNQQG